jgi:hypothetical protein
MKTSNFMNFFVKEASPYQADVLACSQATGLLLESDGHPVQNSNGFVQITEYDQGFRMAVCITWNPSVHPCRPQEVVALNLAKELQQQVLFDVEDPAAPSGEQWILAMPNGTIKTVAVLEYENGVGLKDPDQAFPEEP